MTAAMLTAPDEFTGRIKGQSVIYRIAKDASGYEVFCGRCGGSGNVGYYHVQDGECFQCNGFEGSLNDITIEKANALFTAQDRAAAKREAKRLAICAERDARVARLAEAHPAVAALLEKAYDDTYNTGRHSSFVRELAAKVHNADGRDLTEAQIAAVARIIDQDAERKAGESPVVTGRVEITGEIISTKVKEGDYGTAYKIVVRDDRGFRIYASLPKAQADEAFDAFGERLEAEGHSVHDIGWTVWFEGSTTEPERFPGVKGRRITFTATVEASQDDKAFGFGSRPSKGAWL